MGCCSFSVEGDVRDGGVFVLLFAEEDFLRIDLELIFGGEASSPDRGLRVEDDSVSSCNIGDFASSKMESSGSLA